MEHTYIGEVLFSVAPLIFVNQSRHGGIRAGNVSGEVSLHLDNRHTITHSYSLLGGNHPDKLTISNFMFHFGQMYS